MSSVVKAVLSPVRALSDAVFGKPSSPGAASLPSYETAGGDRMKNLSQDVATRENILQQQAIAAGAERSDNQADLLGNIRTPKKRAAASALLG